MTTAISVNVRQATISVAADSPTTGGNDSAAGPFGALMASQQHATSPAAVGFEQLAAQALAKLAAPEADSGGAAEVVVSEADVGEASGNSVPPAGGFLPPLTPRPAAAELVAAALSLGGGSLQQAAPVAATGGTARLSAADAEAAPSTATIALPLRSSMASLEPPNKGGAALESLNAGDVLLARADGAAATQTPTLLRATGTAEQSATLALSISQHAINDPSWSQALAARLQLMAGRGVQHASLRLHPEELGGIHIQLSMNGDRAAVQFQTQHGDTSELLERLMPRLSQAMEQQGLRLEDAKVQHQPAWGDASSARQQFGNGGQSLFAQLGDHRESLSDSEPEPTPPAATGEGGESAVDLYA